jgi:hypothetical protein
LVLLVLELFDLLLQFLFELETLRVHILHLLL